MKERMGEIKKEPPKEKLKSLAKKAAIVGAVAGSLLGAAGCESPEKKADEEFLKSKAKTEMVMPDSVEQQRLAEEKFQQNLKSLKKRYMEIEADRGVNTERFRKSSLKEIRDVIDYDVLSIIAGNRKLKGLTKAKVDSFYTEFGVVLPVAQNRTAWEDVYPEVDIFTREFRLDDEKRSIEVVGIVGHDGGIAISNMDNIAQFEQQIRNNILGSMAQKNALEKKLKADRIKREEVRKNLEKELQ